MSRSAEFYMPSFSQPIDHQYMFINYIGETQSLLLCSLWVMLYFNICTNFLVIGQYCTSECWHSPNDENHYVEFTRHFFLNKKHCNIRVRTISWLLWMIGNGFRCVVYKQVEPCFDHLLCLVREKLPFEVSTMQY